ncbi:hypothetical protein ACFOEK_05095 [Litoribrevibacter euphylliae]|uniref:Uncharacterized protein n=1 Tax=Litoribrevibacter euphylliae TaxID=1834034 RepID=A0ABV7H920_9GAMM
MNYSYLWLVMRGGLFSVLLCVLSQPNLVYANNPIHTFHCKPEAGAGLEHTGAGAITANLYDVSSLSLTLTNESGHWQLWENNDQEPIFARCQSEFRCEPKEGFFGIFYMTKEHVFTYLIQKAYPPQLRRQIVYSFKGHCQPVVKAPPSH